jgi:hypothetical protein
VRGQDGSSDILALVMVDRAQKSERHEQNG